MFMYHLPQSWCHVVNYLKTLVHNSWVVLLNRLELTLTSLQRFLTLRAIELAQHFHYLNSWLETDSSLVILAFKDYSIVLWSLRKRLSNSLGYTRSMNLIITHIYREDNKHTDSLVNIDLSLYYLYN